MNALKIYLFYFLGLLKNNTLNFFLSGLTLFQVVYSLFVLTQKNKNSTINKLNRLRAVLVISPDTKIGDNVINSLFLKNLRKYLPEAYIVLIHNSITTEIYKNCPHINKRVEISFDMKSVKSLFIRPLLCRKFFNKNLPDVFFDLAFIPRWDEDLFSPFFLWFSAARYRIGFSRKVNSRKAIRAYGTDFFYTHSMKCKKDLHEAIKSKMLLDSFFERSLDDELSLEAYYSDIDSIAASNYLPKTEYNFLIAISPGAAELKRKWPLTSFVGLINRLVDLEGVHVVLLGSKDDKENCQIIFDAISNKKISNLSGLLNLNELPAFLSMSDLYIGNDSGLIHVSSSVKTSVVEISCHPIGADPGGSNSPIRFGPLGVHGLVLQPKRYKSFLCKNGCIYNSAHCIKNVTVEEAYSAVLLSILKR